MKTKYKLDYEIFESPNKNTNPKPQIWFAFHGVGQNTEAFKHFINQNNLKIYSFGLFYHEKMYDTNNQNDIENTRQTTLKNWFELMHQFLKEENINFQENSINIVGFSLGARPALQFVSHFSASLPINQIILIAPETLAISKWYRFGTQTDLGKLILQKLISSIYFKKIIISLSPLFFSKNARKVIEYKIHNGINSLAYAWQAYRSFEIYGTKWKEIYSTNKEKITIVASKNDNFVKLRKVQHFVKKHSTDKGKSIKWILSHSSHSRLLREFRL